MTAWLIFASMAAVAALLSTAAIPGQAQAADDVERSVHMRYGQPNGFQEVRHNADGSISVHYEFNDKGRGPKFDAQYRLAADGTLLQFDSEGVDYLKAPISDHFSLVDGQAHWHNTAENEQRAASTPVFYKSLYAPSEEFHLLVQALLKAPRQKLNLLPGGEVSLRKIDEKTVQGKAGIRKLSLYAMSGLSDGSPDYYWQDAGGHFFVDSAVVPEGWKDILPQLHKFEDAQDKKLRRDRATALTQHLDQALAHRTRAGLRSGPTHGEGGTDSAGQRRPHCRGRRRWQRQYPETSATSRRP